MDEATWAAFAATLTLLGLAWTWVSYRRRGLPSGIRALGFSMLPAAAWLTGTLELVTRTATAVADWAAGLVLSPITWAGIVLGATGVLLIITGGFLRDRQLGIAASSRDRVTPAPIDRDLADIEALLKKRGDR